MIWDLSRAGDEQAEDDAADGPPELLFIHGGHTAKVRGLGVEGGWVRFFFFFWHTTHRLTPTSPPSHQVSDLSWSQEEEYVLASTAEDNILQIASPAREIFG